MRAKSVNFPQENKKTHPEDELRDRICNEQIRYGLLITASIKGCKKLLSSKHWKDSGE